MRKVIKTIFTCVVVLALAFVGIRYGNRILDFIIGRDSSLTWYSTTLSETLKEANELTVYKVETEGTEVISNNITVFGATIGTTQKISIPYTFNMEFKADLSKATISGSGNTIEIRIPSPYTDNSKLIVDEKRVQKSDFFDPITHKQQEEYYRQIEDKLFAQYSADEECIKAAWASTESNIRNLISSAFQNANKDFNYIIKIIRDDTLLAPAATPVTVE